MFHIGVPGTPKAKKVKPIYKKYSSHTILNLPPLVPYTGFRWQLPWGIKAKASHSFLNKFYLFDTLPIDMVFSRIHSHINRPFPHVFAQYNMYIGEWKPPACVQSAIQSHTDRQRNDFRRVKILYAKLFKFTEQFKRLIQHWRVNTCMRNCKNTLDTVTLETPRNSVYVLDFTQRTSYVYEASSLRKTIENRIFLSDYMFPEPKEPINTLSNLPFTYGQLLSIHKQCKAYGQFSWILDRYIACDCCVRTFELRFEKELHYEAIKSFFIMNSNAANDTVIDFFEDQIRFTPSISGRMIQKFTDLCMDTTRNPIHPYIQKWRSITRRYYCATELRDHLELARIAREIPTLVSLAKRVLI